MTDTEIGPPAPATAPSPAGTARPESFGARVVNTFVAPLALFRRFGERPPWVDVFVVSVVVTAAAMAFLPAEVWESTIREAIRQNPDLAARGRDPAAMAGFQRIAGVAASLVMPWIVLALTAGLLTLVFSVGMGGTARFRQYVAVVAHASLIGAVGTVLTVPVMIARGDIQAGINLAAVAPGLDHTSFAWLFLSSLSVFALWQTVVVGIGAGAVNRRIRPGTAVAVVLAVYVAVAATIALVRA